jgi:hypothetical protein
MKLRHSSVVRNVLAFVLKASTFFADSGYGKMGHFTLPPSKLTTTHFVPPSQMIQMSLQWKSPSNIAHLVANARECEGVVVLLAFLFKVNAEIAENSCQDHQRRQIGRSRRDGDRSISKRMMVGVALAGIFSLALHRGRASSTGITISLQHPPNIK